MSRLRSVHWLAPTTMVLALLGAFALALGHHVFYESLNHKSVPTGSYTFAGKKLPKQQFNTAVGTAFALLVRISLAIAISTAYIQIFWRSITNTKQSPTLAEIDSVKAGLDNILSLFNIKLVYKYPLLLLLAIIFWCFPIATIFPPATLSVESVVRVPTSMLQVPQFDFTTLKFAAALPTDGTEFSPDTNWKWNGPSQPIQNMALTVIGLGQILPINPPAPNASWTIEFWGPALQCSDVVAADRDKIYTNIWNSFNGTNTSPHTFLSWVPWTASDIVGSSLDSTVSNLDLPFQPAKDVTSDNLVGFSQSPIDGLVDFSQSSISINGSASLFIAVLPDMVNFGMLREEVTNIWYTYPEYEGCTYQTIQNLSESISGCSPNATFMPALVYEDSTLLRCDLVNTSYSVKFNYLSGAQDIQISSNITGNSPNVITSGYFTGPLPPGYAYSNTQEANCSTFQAAYDKGTIPHMPCVFDVSAVRLLSYQGIMAAFNELVIGSIDNEGSLNTMIMKTVLAQTDELVFLRDWSPTPDGAYDPDDLQTVVSSTVGWAYPGLVTSVPSGTRGDLKSTLGQLFQNLTISLLAEPYFQPNYSSPFAPPKLTNVSLQEYRNIYNYDRTTLWITYGLSILFTTLVVIAGMITLSLNGVSYSDNFSTIVRVCRTVELNADIKDQDRTGHDPLPTYLKHARLKMGANTATTNAYKMTDTTPEEQSLVRVS